MSVNDYLRDINEASKNGRLTFFVGAGISKLSKYPDWKDLTNEFAEKLGLEKKDENSNYTNEEYLSIPQKYYYSIRKNNEEYYKFIKKQLDRDDIEPNMIHDLMLILKPASIITTNFDNLIEKSVSKQGLFYDVIASDSNVSNVKSSKFILKVHGDLNNENIVLKEEDYLNYSNNFKLIETLLKSIFSTNTVIFIGYTLGDYNIKLILNWVRSLQGEGFRTPYFIYAGNKILSDLDMMYYQSRGLNIINYKEFSEEEEEWLPRYKIVLQKIIDFEENDLQKKDSESIDYLYKLLTPLNQLNALRREDVQVKLAGDYIIDDNGIIVRRNLEADYLEKFNNVYKRISRNIEIDKLEKSTIDKYEVIKEVFGKAHIYECRDGSDILEYDFNYKFKNGNSFSLDYQFMETYARKNYNNLEEEYIRAYFLFKIGNFKESYDIYTEISQKCFEEKNYLMYYFSQVNRYNVYMAINALGNYAKSVPGILTGYADSGENLLEETDVIMKSFDVDEVFQSLPLDFKSNYSSLKDLYNQKYLYKNIYMIMNAVEKVNNSIKNKSIELGYTSIHKVIGILKPHLNFVYGNYLIVDEYNEFKAFVKEAMKAILLTYADESNEYLSEDKLQEIRRTNKGIKLDMMDFSCIIQYFEKKELKNIFRQYGIKQLEFIDEGQCFKIAKNLFEYYKIKNNNFCNRYLRQKIEQYLNNLIEILKYTKLTKEQYVHIVNEIFSIDNNTLNIGNKIMFLDKQEAYNTNIHNNIYHILEDVFIDYLDEKIKCIKDGLEFDEDSINGLYHVHVVNYIVANKKNFKSDKINKKIIQIIEDKININIEELIQITPILPENTTDGILLLSQDKLKVDFNFNILKMLVEYDLVEDIEEYEEKLVELIRYKINKFKNLKKDYKDRKKLNIEVEEFQYIPDILLISDLEKNINSLLEYVGYWCFVGIANMEKFIEFKSINNQFDFFIDIDSFDFNKFESDWLIKFNNVETHKNIAKHQKSKDYIKNVIEEYLKNPNFDISQKEWFLKLYIDVYTK